MLVYKWLKYYFGGLTFLKFSWHSVRSRLFSNERTWKISYNFTDCSESHPPPPQCFDGRQTSRLPAFTHDNRKARCPAWRKQENSVPLQKQCFMPPPLEYYSSNRFIGISAGSESVLWKASFHTCCKPSKLFSYLVRKVLITDIVKVIFTCHSNFIINIYVIIICVLQENVVTDNYLFQKGKIYYLGNMRAAVLSQNQLRVARRYDWWKSVLWQQLRFVLYL